MLSHTCLNLRVPPPSRAIQLIVGLIVRGRRARIIAVAPRAPPACRASPESDNRVLASCSTMPDAANKWRTPAALRSMCDE
jgi:hypothetical protein